MGILRIILSDLNLGGNHRSTLLVQRRRHMAMWVCYTVSDNMRDARDIIIIITHQHSLGLCVCLLEHLQHILTKLCKTLDLDFRHYHRYITF